MRTPWRRRTIPGRDFIWTAADQALASISNVLISFAVAHAGGASSLGEYQIAFAIWVVTIGFLRQLVTEPYLTLPRRDPAASRAIEPAVLGAAVLYAAPISAVTLLVGALGLGTHIVLIGVFLVPLSLHEAVRYVFFRQERPGAAVTLDGIWVVISAASWPVVSGGGSAHAVLMWGLGGASSALVGLMLMRRLPANPRRSLRWWLEDARGFGGYLAFAGIVYYLGSQGAILGLAVLLGTSAVGVLRSVLIVLGPVILLQTAIAFYAVPRMSRRPDSLTQGTGLRLAVATVAIVMTAAIPIVSLHRPLMRFFFGSGLVPPLVVVWALTLHLVLGAAGAAFVMALRARRAGKKIFVTNAITYLSGAGLVLGGASLFGLEGAAWGYATQSILLVGVTFVAWRMEVGSRPGAESPGLSTSTRERG